MDGDTTNVVTLANHPGADGKISFPEAVTAVDNSGPGFTIGFNLPHGSTLQTGAASYIITAHNTTIDGDVDGDGLPDIAVYNTPSGIFQVSIAIETDHVVLRNLSIGGLLVDTDAAHDCQISGCYLGVDVDGRTRLPVFGDGLEIRDSAHNNAVTGCIASGNLGGSSSGSSAVGIFIHLNAHDNTVQGCRVGVDINGAALPNDLGLIVGANTEAAPNNTIGGVRTVSSNPGNVISGNDGNGLEVIGPGTTGNTVQGNFIGLDPTGTKAVPNGGASQSTAFFVGRGAANNIIGGIRLSLAGGAGNLISGNTGAGLGMRYAGSTGNKVMGNLIGTDVSGVTRFPNGGAGIQIQDGASNNVIGNGLTGAFDGFLGNRIVGNAGAGVKVVGTATGNSIRGNEIRGNGALGIDLSANDRALGDHVTPNDVDDSDAGPNDLTNFPVGVTAWYDANANNTIISGILPRPDPDKCIVDIYVSRTVDPSGFGEGEQYVGSVKPVVSGTFRLVVPGRLPAGLPFLGATSTDALGNTSEFGPTYGDPDGDGSVDSDGDGLPDEWETKGIDFDGDGTIDLDLHALAADSRHKDIFVEIDYMEAADHTHKPTLRPDKSALSIDPLAAVTAAFAASPVVNPDGVTGINLHAMVDESITEVTPLLFDSRGPGAADDFDDLKLGNPASIANGHVGSAADRASTNAANIIGAHRLAFHYCIFGHNCAESIGSSGISEIGGNDLMVTLRAHDPGPNNDYEDDANTISSAWGTTFDAEWADLVAGTFMHELGHNLGLEHGGGRGIPDAQAANRAINGKPNYLSVMRYGRQFNEAGAAQFLPGVANGTWVRQQRPLDYSRTALRTLEEISLDEPEGIGGSAGQRTLYGYLGNRRIGPSSGAIDWNDSGVANELDLREDVNFLSSKPSLPASPDQTLMGHDDWSNLVYNFQASIYYDDGELQPETPEETDRDYLIGCLGEPPGPDVALKIAGGLQTATALDMVVLNVVTTGSSASRVDLLDAIRLLRQRSGLDR
ncbi:MAG TPA: hypothetical protein VGM37_03385 [Armatimonadota bacterium]|jgi:hypothetical protein